MKTLSVIILFVSALTVLCASYAAHAYDWRPCHQGHVEVKTCSDLEELQEMKCINGSLWVGGILNICDEVFFVLDMPKLEYVKGTITIMGAPRLNEINAPVLEYAWSTIVQNNPMLPTCEAVDVGLQTGAKDAGRYTAQLNQGECDYE